MPRPRTRRSYGRPSKRTPQAWYNNQFGPTNVAAGSSIGSTVLAGPEQAAMPDTFQAGFTIVRMILEVFILAQTINQPVFGNFGVAVIDENSSGIDTILDLLDYYVLQPFSNETDSTSVLQRATRYVYDIRTARRIRGRERRLEFCVRWPNVADVVELHPQRLV